MTQVSVSVLEDKQSGVKWDDSAELHPIPVLPETVAVRRSPHLSVFLENLTTKPTTVTSHIPR